MVYVFKGRGFCDRDDLELFHKAIHLARTRLKRQALQGNPWAPFLSLTVCQLMNKVS